MQWSVIIVSFLLLSPLQITPCIELAIHGFRLFQMLNWNFLNLDLCFKHNYYTLQSRLQIQRSALWDNGTLRAHHLTPDFTGCQGFFQNNQFTTCTHSNACRCAGMIEPLDKYATGFEINCMRCLIIQKGWTLNFASLIVTCHTYA